MIIKVQCLKRDCSDRLVEFLTSQWAVEAERSKMLASSVFNHISRLDNCKSVLIEYPYVDKVYRNSYYHYFASKKNKYPKNCIRLSFFKSEVDESLFRDFEDNRVQEAYLGFMIVRPTIPSLIGRSTISPSALTTPMRVCTASINASANGLKLHVQGFPHSSQDGETISCAETTLWCLMEYFSSRYQDYNPVLPSDIIRVLSKTSSERQLPSAGLNITQMAYALKELGFGPRIYAAPIKPVDGDPPEYFFYEILRKQFNALVSIYIESGIPLMAGLSSQDNSIGHAALLIGRSEIQTEAIDTLEPAFISDYTIRADLSDKGFEYYDFHDVERQYVMNDDNSASYTICELDAPCAHYDADTWKSCIITHVAAPLYPKMYLEAETARSYFILFLFQILMVQEHKKTLLTRFYMTSSRSYKDYLARNSGMQDPVREALIELEMPKFVWIGELSSKDLIKKKKADGFVILDATEANRYDLNPLIGVYFNGKFYRRNTNDDIEEFAISLQPFSIYTENLKSNQNP